MLSKNNKQIEMSADYITHFKTTFKLSDKQLGQIIGVAPATINFWETAQRGIPETTARLLVLFMREPDLMEEFKGLNGTYTATRLT